MARQSKFTRIPKVQDFLSAGVPHYCIPTYCALADHSNNKSALCFPKMKTLAYILKLSVRTIQRHLHILKECGLIQFVERRRHKGKFSSYLYKILFVPTTGHQRPPRKRSSIKNRTRPVPNTPIIPKSREEEAKRRSEGFEWYFQ